MCRTIISSVCNDLSQSLNDMLLVRDQRRNNCDEDKNRKHYGQPTPPIYNMTSIPNDLPLFLSYGGADALSDVRDVRHLLDSLKDHDGDKLVVQYRSDFAHADYVMAPNAKQDVYDPLIAFFKLQ